MLLAVESWFAFPVGEVFFFFLSNVYGEFWVFSLIAVLYNFVSLCFLASIFIHPAQHLAGLLFSSYLSLLQEHFLLLFCWLFMFLNFFLFSFLFPFKPVVRWMLSFLDLSSISLIFSILVSFFTLWSWSFPQLFGGFYFIFYPSNHCLIFQEHFLNCFIFLVDYFCFMNVTLLKSLWGLIKNVKLLLLLPSLLPLGSVALCVHLDLSLLYRRLLNFVRECLSSFILG